MTSIASLPLWLAKAEFIAASGCAVTLGRA